MTEADFYEQASKIVRQIESLECSINDIRNSDDSSLCLRIDTDSDTLFRCRLTDAMLSVVTAEIEQQLEDLHKSFDNLKEDYRPFLCNHSPNDAIFTLFQDKDGND